MKERMCESCGMPMKEVNDFGGGDLSNKYCVHCTDESGVLNSYEVQREKMARFIMSRSGATHEAALKSAAENMAKMPAWKEASL